MPADRSRYAEWHEAEQRAAAAELKLFSQVHLFLGPPGCPSRAELEEVHALRRRASGLLKEMLDEMRGAAAALRLATSAQCASQALTSARLLAAGSPASARSRTTESR